MFWLIFFPLVAMFLFRRGIYHVYKGAEEYGPSRLAAVLMAVFICLPSAFLGFIAASIANMFLPHVWQKGGETALVSLHDFSGVKMRFFMGSSTFESKPYYYYYVGDVETGYSPRKLPADLNVRIFEEKRSDGQIIWYQKVVDPVWSWLGFNNPDNIRYEFRIPEGSLRQDFSIG